MSVPYSIPAPDDDWSEAWTGDPALRQSKHAAVVDRILARFAGPDGSSYLRRIDEEEVFLMFDPTVGRWIELKAKTSKYLRDDLMRYMQQLLAKERVHGVNISEAAIHGLGDRHFKSGVVNELLDAAPYVKRRYLNRFGHRERHVVPLENGVLDLERLELVEHPDPEWMFTNAFPLEWPDSYEPVDLYAIANQPTPRHENPSVPVLLDMFDRDVDSLRYVLNRAALALLGRARKEALIFDSREAHRGKSTLARAFYRAFGPFGVDMSLQGKQFLFREVEGGHTDALMDLDGKLLAVFDEMPAEGRLSSLFRFLTGGNMELRGSRKGKQAETIYTAALPIITANGADWEVDKSAAIERLTCIPFGHYFPEDEESRLKSFEKDAGYLLLLIIQEFNAGRPLPRSEAITTATDDLRDRLTQDSVDLASLLGIDVTGDPGDAVPVAELMHRYEALPSKPFRSWRQARARLVDMGARSKRSSIRDDSGQPVNALRGVRDLRPVRQY